MQGGGRFVVEIPPRHGKSQFISRWFPVWFLNMFPDKSVILSSYSVEYAVQWGRLVRNAIDEHQERLSVAVASDSAAAQRWNTTAGGGMYAVGVGGSLIGRGGDVMILDDPIKNDEEANSAFSREKMWDWYQSTWRSRLEPGGTIIILMTRWHVDDLVGRLLQHDPEGWTRVRFPAIAEEHDILGRKPGDALWPERYNLASLDAIKKDTSSYWFSALYQQNPIPREGGFFKRDWFEIVEAAPTQHNRVRFWDLAGSDAIKQNSNPDYTVGTLVSKTGGKYYIEDVVRLRGTPAEVERRIKATAILDGPRTRVHIEQEPGSSGAYVITRFREILDDFVVKPFRPTGPKELYADKLAARAEAAVVKIVRAAWNDDWLNELESFPRGMHDDQVDSAAKGVAVVSKRSWGVANSDGA
jgi:predicted phage terminase large subunit-like protein